MLLVWIGLLQELLWLLADALGAVTITPEDVRRLPLRVWQLRLDFWFSSRSAHYDIVGIASARHLLDD